MTRCSELLCLFALITINTHAAPINPRQLPIVDTLTYPCTGSHWDDSDMTEVCKTMCYGINCMGLPAVMYRDFETKGKNKAAKAECKKRGDEAGCGKGNRCGKSPYGTGYQCDEFPFKSTDRQAAMSKRIPPINRCVPEKQNTLQGNVLKQFYGSTGSTYKNGGGLHGEEGWFKLAFQGYAGISYCEDASTRNCDNDGNIYDKVGLAYPPPPLTLDPPHRYYLTKRGVNLFIPAGAEIGDAVHSHGEDGNVELDEIVALANATSIAE